MNIIEKVDMPEIMQTVSIKKADFVYPAIEKVSEK